MFKRHGLTAFIEVDDMKPGYLLHNLNGDFKSSNDLDVTGQLLPYLSGSIEEKLVHHVEASFIFWDNKWDIL